MKRIITIPTSVAILLSVAAPAFALPNTMVQEKLSRRLIRSEAIVRQRIPDTAMPVELLLQERRQAQADATGRSQLQRALRMRTLKGVSTKEAGKSTSRPSRRSIEKAAEEQSSLPPSLVVTGLDKRTARVVSRNRPTRRTTVNRARKANVVEVAPLVPTIPPLPVAPTTE